MSSPTPKFKKGSFILVPNRSKLHELPANAQQIWMWLCCFANDDGECFPSRKTLANCANVTEKTIDKAIKELVKKNWLKKFTRNTEDGGNKSNLYQLHLLD